MKRKWIQIFFTFFLNAYSAGFARGRIFKGKTKLFCVPVLNCYSCPGALGSCPIGSLQSILSGERKISFYVLGLITLFGIILGRLVCAFVCPFGFFQDMLFKVRTKKIKIKDSTDRKLRYAKYFFLAVFVIILPVFAKDELGLGTTWFCTYICPAGTLEAGIPLLVAVPGLRAATGFLFSWKMLVLAATIFLSTKISRPFCKYVCPLGAFYGLFSGFSLFQIKLNENKCIHCLKCEQACPMGVRCTQKINTAECIKCGKCISICPVKAIDITTEIQKRSAE